VLDYHFTVGCRTLILPGRPHGLPSRNRIASSPHINFLSVLTVYEFSKSRSSTASRAWRPTLAFQTPRNDDKIPRLPPQDFPRKQLRRGRFLKLKPEPMPHNRRRWSSRSSGRLDQTSRTLQARATLSNTFPQNCEFYIHTALTVKLRAPELASNLVGEFHTRVRATLDNQLGLSSILAFQRPCRSLVG
jgi:hypothetical protein